MLHTPLHAAHLAQGAKMGEFAGYDMPLYYNDGVMAEHEWVRTQAGLFDVSHMGQILLDGPGVVDFLEYMTPSGFSKLPVGRAKYTVLTNENGGIVDDLIVTRLGPDRYFAVINAGCKDKDIAWLRGHLTAGVGLEILDDRALIAVQGPAAAETLQTVTGFDPAAQPYMWFERATLPDGADMFISRLGYTGEDGFELSVPAGRAESLWQEFSAQEAVRPIGLAARDSLRLDMGYCLYGHDIDAETTPVEAGLAWTIGRDNLNFIGHGIILPQRDLSAPRTRVGLRLLEPGIAREGALVQDLAGRPIGQVTSGGFSPTLKSAIAQAYLEPASAGDGHPVQVVVRGRPIRAEVAPMPFLPARTKPATIQRAA